MRLPRTFVKEWNKLPTQTSFISNTWTNDHTLYVGESLWDAPTGEQRKIKWNKIKWKQNKTKPKATMIHEGIESKPKKAA